LLTLAAEMRLARELLNEVSISKQAKAMGLDDERVLALVSESKGRMIPGSQSGPS
jgi:hypothetical protein